MLNCGGKVYRNIQEQVQKNKEDIERLNPLIMRFDCNGLSINEFEEKKVNGIWKAINNGTIILENISFIYEGDQYDMKTISLLNEEGKGYSSSRTFCILIGDSAIDHFVGSLTIDDDNNISFIIEP